MIRWILAIEAYYRHWITSLCLLASIDTNCFLYVIELGFLIKFFSWPWFPKLTFDSCSGAIERVKCPSNSFKYIEALHADVLHDFHWRRPNGVFCHNPARSSYRIPAFSTLLLLYSNRLFCRSTEFADPFDWTMTQKSHFTKREKRNHT